MFGTIVEMVFDATSITDGRPRANLKHIERTRSGNLTMKYALFDKLNRRKSAEMFTKPQLVEETFKQREYQPSREHRTEIQLELQELRKLVLASDTLATAHRTELK